MNNSRRAQINMTFPKKSLSQNYLRDENICRKIVEAFDIGKDDKILEIGSGQGALTKYIADRTKKLVGIELDKNNCAILSEKFPDLQIYNDDILKTDFGKMSRRFDSKGKIRVIGNIPYNITSQILFKLIDNRNLISNALMMMQEEVAKRLIANPNTKDYGITSVFTQVFSKPGLLFKVSKNCFYPKPKVDSRMIKFDFETSLEDRIENIEFFRKFVRTAFGKRRKTLRNALKDMEIDVRSAGVTFDFGRRAETLTPIEFIDLSNKFYRQD